MNFNYVLKSGSANFQDGLSSLSLNNAIQDSNYSSFSVANNVMTGRHSILMSVNSQTLLEETPSYEYKVNGDIVYKLNTGDFYIKTELAQYKNTVFTDLDNQKNHIIYDQRNHYTGLAIYKPDTGVGYFQNYLNDLRVDLQDRGESVANLVALTGFWDIFFNGQKLTTINDSILDTITGKIFVIKKPTGIYEQTSTNPDVINTNGFMKNGVNLYVNGMEQDKSLYLALYTGVSLIEAGQSSIIDFSTGDTLTATYIL